MTIEEAKEYISDIDGFCKDVCNCCRANDWYCPKECDTLKKARHLDFNRILKCYARNGGDMLKIINYIRTARI